MKIAEVVIKLFSDREAVGILNSRLGNFGDYFASPIAADGKVFIAGKNGFIVVLEDGPELKVLGKNDLGEEIIATPAIADGRLFVRTRESLICVGGQTPQP